LFQRTGSRGRGENAERNRRSDRLPAAVHAELLVDIDSVTVHGLVRHYQLLRNLLGGHVLRQQLQNLHLSCRVAAVNRVC